MINVSRQLFISRLFISNIIAKTWKFDIIVMKILINSNGFSINMKDTSVGVAPKKNFKGAKKFHLQTAVNFRNQIDYTHILQ